MYKIIMIFLLFIFVTGCSTARYIYDQAKGQFKLLASKRTFENVLKDPNINDDIKGKIRLILELRDFIEDQLDLDLKGNYLTYVDLKSSWVVKLLTVSEKCKIEPYLWKFPIIGEMPYLGFFLEKNAREAEKKYFSKGYDTHIRDVRAYSTLGWFKDPIFSSFLSNEDFFIISTVIHEAVHLNIFKKNDMVYNENIASFIEEKGTLIFLNRKSADPELEKRYLKFVKENQNIDQFIKKIFEELNDFYNNISTCNEEVLKGREEKFLEFENVFYSRFGYKIKLNNAYIAGINTYTSRRDKFENEFNEKFGGDLKLFIKHHKKSL